MNRSAEDQKFTLRPSWKHFFWPYLLSILAIPLLGLGLIALYVVRKKHKSITYTITDTQIATTDDTYEQHVDLVDIDTIKLQQKGLQQKLGVGTLFLHTSTCKMELAGIQQPYQIKEILEEAIQSEQKRQEKQQETTARQPKYNPGSMPKLDYLTGLWQQGLISDEDYEAERKHFE